MNFKYCKWLKYGLVGALALVGFNACSDDHFDIHSSTPKQSLWEQIVADPQLDSLKMILERTTFTVDEFSKTSKLTYAQLLAGSQTFTVWAPKNGTYNAAHWLELLAQGKNREVEKQFVRNHIARYNFSGTNGDDTIKVTMLNSKIIDYDRLENTFKKIPLEGSVKEATNGSLHLLDGQAPFASNLYEAIEFTENMDSLYNFLHEDDSLMFIKGASTPGATVNGEIQYVDSVFIIYNKVIGSMGFWQNEDSLMMGVLPTNKAWGETMEKVSKYFKYKDAYPYVQDNTTKVLWNKFDKDSMADVRIKHVILNNIVTSLGKQPGYDVKATSLSYFKNFIDNADSLVRGGYTSITDPNIHQPYLAKIVEGAEPQEVSNGYIYPVDHYGYTPSKSWHHTIRVEAEYQFYQDINGFASAEKNGTYYGNTVYLNSLNRNDSITGYVSNNAFAYFPGANSASQPTVSFKIPSVLSGKYDIYAVMVPLNLDKPAQTTEDTKRNHFRATLVYDYNDKNGREIVQQGVAYDSIGNELLDSKGKNVSEYETRAGVIDSVLLFKDFEFPYAFYGAEPSYVKLRLKSVVSKAAEKKKYDPALYIDCFLFVSKDDDTDL